ncbi:ABC transporter ATP-binding protein [Aeoliella sp. SH292]|uniref:ABC transporter ATP-binding protein n=1 Tax=Aeoliella sp. SH292 TaxID=3454464 RepID=UPI003F97B0E5
MNVLRATDLTRRYGTRVAVDQLNLEVARGEIFGFLGPNGAGKTTTIRMLMGLMRPDGGRAEISGRDCWTESAAVKREVGYVPGDLRLYPWMTLRNGLKIVSQVRGKDLTTAGHDLAEQFELEPTLPVRKMSRGTRQKLGLILAMAHQPQLLILDEPTSGLDPLMQSVLGSLIRKGAEHGQTIFFSSHTLSEVDSLCHRVAIIRRGKIIVDEPLLAIRDRAPRIVELIYRDAQTATGVTLPAFLTEREQFDATITCRLEGPAKPLLQWAFEQPLVDLRVGRPDLDALFHSLYHQVEGTA